MSTELASLALDCASDSYLFMCRRVFISYMGNKKRGCTCALQVYLLFSYCLACRRLLKAVVSRFFKVQLTGLHAGTSRGDSSAVISENPAAVRRRNRCTAGIILFSRARDSH